LDKYTRTSKKTESSSQRRKNQIRSIVMIVLLVALVALGIYSTSAIVYRNESQELIIDRMQSECGNALVLTNSLSRTAGTNSSAQLGKIRSSVYAVETLNDMYASLNRVHLVSDEQFESLFALIDEYGNKVITGMNTGELQTALLNEINALQSIVNAIR